MLVSETLNGTLLPITAILINTNIWVHDVKLGLSLV